MHSGVRNDPRQYDDLAGQWWRPGGDFEMLHWLAAARGALIPRAPRPGAVLLDAGCGGGLLAPHVQRLDYRHVGVDLRRSGLEQSASRGVAVVAGAVAALPLADAAADVVVAGEILEHVEDDVAVLAEAARLLRPGGTLVIDALAATWLADLIAVRILERVPQGPPPGIHDPALFVDRRRLLAAAPGLGLDLELVGLRPSVRDMVRWRRGRRDGVRMKRLPTTAVLFAGYGRKR